MTRRTDYRRLVYRQLSKLAKALMTITALAMVTVGSITLLRDWPIVAFNASLAVMIVTWLATVIVACTQCIVKRIEGKTPSKKDQYLAALEHSNHRLHSVRN